MSDPPFFSETAGWTGAHNAQDIRIEMLRVHPSQPCACPRCLALLSELRTLESKPILVYVAGPFSAKIDRLPDESDRAFAYRQRAAVERNIARAVERGIEVARLGYFPIVPHANTAHPEFEQIQPYGFWVDGYIAVLKMCAALITVPGWEQSSGATRERVEMNAMGRPVFDSIVSLRSWRPR